MKPCPFCGCKAEIVTLTIGDPVTDTLYYPQCTNKECIAHEENEDDADKEAVIRAWNKRV